MQEPLDPELAQDLQRRLRRSGYLIPALRQALVDLGRPELAGILDLIREDVTGARIAVEGAQAVDAQCRRLQTLGDLAHLARLGGTKGQRVAQRVASRMAR